MSGLKEGQLYHIIVRLSIRSVSIRSGPPWRDGDNDQGVKSS